MFDPVDTARIFAVPPGVDFPRALVDGLVERSTGAPPEALAQVQLVVNTRRMARRIQTLFEDGPARLLPRISLITEVGEPWHKAAVPPAFSPLRRRLELAQLIARLIEQQPDIAARASVFDLADSLAALMDEMQGEGVSTEVIGKLDVSDLSGHWARAQAFFDIAQRFSETTGGAIDPQARQRQIVEAQITAWEATPPDHPIILAGSTGSRGTTLMLMAAVARLPQGAVVLPGYDFDQPDTVWDQLSDGLRSEDHPQYRFRDLMRTTGIGPADIRLWGDAPAPSPDRNRLVSLALRPAPFTDAWMREGPDLHGLAEATSGVTLVEASSPRAEALAVALRLRQAAEDGQTAALITPDRMLTRQVSAALDRWNILPDDSAGLPLQLSPPGRFLRHVAGLFTKRLDGEALLTLLKHPLTHSGGERGEHLRQTRNLELHLRRHGPPYPDADSFARYGARDGVPDGWAAWLSACFANREVSGDRPLLKWVQELRDLAEHITGGTASDGPGELWEQNAGQLALVVLDDLGAEAVSGGPMSAHEFADLLGHLLAGQEVRDRDAPHDRIMIWGTLEARVQGADLVILGGLNEGSWPEPASPDPWLNREMRLQAGLLLPERRIGLSAHDFQQAIAAPEVWLTRARQSDDAETVASRWLNRITNLLGGLEVQGGADLLAQMRARGDQWLDWADQLEDAPDIPSAPRPSPRPPVTARPRELSVTAIKQLIRDPYAIYARHVLRLKPLDPLVQAPDALVRGIVVHKVFEDFIRATTSGEAQVTRDDLLAIARQVLEKEVPWPTARSLWLARIERVADWFIEQERERRQTGDPIRFEVRAKAGFADPPFTLKGVADRIDRREGGAIAIYDYKTGNPPSAREQAAFDKQLLIEAAMAEQGGFADLGPVAVSDAVFIGLGANPKEVSAPLEEEPPGKIWADLRKLIAAYFDPEQGFTSRRMLQKDSDTGDFDQLARFGEWDRGTDPTPEDLA